MVAFQEYKLTSILAFEMYESLDIGSCDLFSGVEPADLFYLLAGRNSKSKSNKTQLYQFEIEMLGGEKYN